MPARIGGGGVEFASDRSRAGARLSVREPRDGAREGLAAIADCRHERHSPRAERPMRRPADCPSLPSRSVQQRRPRDSERMFAPHSPLFRRARPRNSRADPRLDAGHADASESRGKAVSPSSPARGSKMSARSERNPREPEPRRRASENENSLAQQQSRLRSQRDCELRWVQICWRYIGQQYEPPRQIVAGISPKSFRFRSRQGYRRGP